MDQPNDTTRVVSDEYDYERHDLEDGDGPGWWRINLLRGERTGSMATRVMSYGGRELNAALDALYAAQQELATWKSVFPDIAPDSVLPDRSLLVAANAQLRDGILAVEALINNSRGVDGLHRNGDVALWAELRRGGRFEEWLHAFDTAIDAARAEGEGK